MRRGGVWHLGRAVGAERDAHGKHVRAGAAVVHMDVQRGRAALCAGAARASLGACIAFSPVAFSPPHSNSCTFTFGLSYSPHQVPCFHVLHILPRVQHT